MNDHVLDDELSIVHELCMYFPVTQTYECRLVTFALLFMRFIIIPVKEDLPFQQCQLKRQLFLGLPKMAPFGFSENMVGRAAKLFCVSRGGSSSS